MAKVSAPPEDGNKDGTMANIMQQLMGSSKATLVGCKATGTFRMQIILDGSITLQDSPTNKAILNNFNLQVGFAPTAYVGFGVGLELTTDQDGKAETTDDQAELRFDGSIQAVSGAVPTMKFQLAMDGIWRNAFGNKHFAIGDLGCSASLTAAPPFITSFALNGEVIVGKESVVSDCMVQSGKKWAWKSTASPSKCFRGVGGFQIDIVNPVNNYFYIGISQLTMETIFGVFMGVDITTWPTCIQQSGFKDRDGDGEALRLEVAPGRAFTKGPGGDLVTLGHGIRLKGEFNILGWGATADIAVNLPTDVKVDVSCDPLNLGGVLMVYKSSSDKNNGPSFHFSAVADRTPQVNLEINAYATLLGFISSEVSVVASNTQLQLSIINNFAGSTTTMMLSAALASSVNNYAFEVAFNWKYSLEKMIEAMKSFMNVADKAMEGAQNSLASANNKLEDAKGKTCDAIGKVCDKVKGRCILDFLGFLGKALCKAWEWLVDTFCEGLCTLAKGVLSVAQGILSFASAVITVARAVMKGITEFMASVFDAIAPIKEFEVNFAGKADFALRRQSSVAVDVTITVRDYYKSLKCAPGFSGSCLAAAFYSPWTFGFNFDFTSVVGTFASMVQTLVEKMFGGKEPNADDKAEKFVGFVNKKLTPPPDVMSADFKPFICKYSPNVAESKKPLIYQKDPLQDDGYARNSDNKRIVDTGAMAIAYSCDHTKDCAHYWGWQNKGVACASKSVGQKCTRASECESWLCVDDPTSSTKECLSKASDTNGKCLQDQDDLSCGDCKKGVCAPAYQKCPEVADRKFDMVCYMPNWAQYRHPNQAKTTGRRPNWRGFLVPERVDPCVCTHYLYSFGRIGVPKRHPDSYSQSPDPASLFWMPAHSEMTDLTIDEYQALPGGCTKDGKECECGKDGCNKREAWFNEGGWNQMHRFNRHIKKLNPDAKTMISLGGWDNEFTQAIGLIARQVNGCDDTVPDI